MYKLCNIFVIREHNGQLEKLAVTLNEDGTLSFKSDKFSTYAVGYVDTVKPETPKPEVSEKEEIKNPETGDEMFAYVLTAIASLVAIAVKKRK